MTKRSSAAAGGSSAKESSPIGSAGSVVRGHEFHYATLTSPGDDAPLADLTDGQGGPLGASGGRRDRVTGTFFHAIAQA